MVNFFTDPWKRKNAFWVNSAVNQRLNLSERKRLNLSERHSTLSTYDDIAISKMESQLKSRPDPKLKLIDQLNEGLLFFLLFLTNRIFTV